MMYLNPIQNENGSYSNLQSTQAKGLLNFPDEFMCEFFKEGKDCAGFVDITHDGKTVLTCVWNENNYRAYIENLPEPKEAEPTTEERITALEEALVQSDEMAIALYEAQEEQEAINAAQDDALIEIYEMMEG